MTTRTYTQKDGTIWEWEETQEVLNLLKEIHETKQNDTKAENVG